MEERLWNIHFIFLVCVSGRGSVANKQVIRLRDAGILKHSEQPSLSFQDYENT